MKNEHIFPLNFRSYFEYILDIGPGSEMFYVHWGELMLLINVQNYYWQHFCHDVLRQQHYVKVQSHI